MRISTKLTKFLVTSICFIILFLNNILIVEANEFGKAIQIADSSGATSLKDMMTQATKFIEKGEEETANSNIPIEDVTSQFVPIGQLLTTIGAGVLVAVTTYMGIKYLTAGPETQAKLKQQLIGVIVSAIVIFGAYGIWQTVGKIAMQFEK